MIKLALIGSGRIGQVHFRNIISNSLAQCTHIISNTIEESNNLINSCNQNNTTIAVNNLESIMDDIDGVIIASSTPSHFSYIKQCLSAQKPVFTEKPICDTLQEIDELFEYSFNMNSKGIFVGYQRRFDPTIQSIYTEIHNNKYLLCNNENISHQLKSTNNIHQHGIEKIISISRDPTYPPVEYLTSNSNAFYDSVVHDVDIICYLTKEYPINVYCSAHSFYEPINTINDYDRMFINLEFESGILGLIDWCRHSGFGYDQQLKVFGYNGMLEMNNISCDNMIKYNDNNGISKSLPKPCFVDRYQDAYYNELNDFISTIRNQQYNVHSTYEQIRNVQIILQAAEYSSSIGQCVNIDYKII